jgi:DNA repair protein RadC
MKHMPTPYTFSDTDIVFNTSKAETDSVYTRNTTVASSDAVSKGREYPLKLRDLPQGDKPREKLLEQGVEALSLQDLIAVVLQFDTKSEDVLSISKRVVREYGHSALVSQLDPKIMAEHLGIPIGKASQIVACSEIGRRLYRKNEFGLQVMRNAQDVYTYLKDMHSLPKEQLRGVYLDTHNRIIHDEVISIGTLNSNIVHPREVFRPALEYGAAAVILAHNHPSSISTPSESDKVITMQLVEAGKILGIRILDHIVVTKDGFESVEVSYE